MMSKAWLPLLRRMTGAGLIVPYYHMVSDEANPYVSRLYAYKGVAPFKADLDFLCRHYRPIDLRELVRRLRAGERAPEGAFLLTFDDGFREMHDVAAPILLEKGIPATFFVNSGFVDNQQMCYLNKASLILETCQKKWSARLEKQVAHALHGAGIECQDVRKGILMVTYPQRSVLDEIAEAAGLDTAARLNDDQPYLTSAQIAWLLGKGFAIGGHSVDHPMYAQLPLEAQLRQTVESVKAVRERFGLDYGAFAFPHNDDGVSSEFFLRLPRGLIDVSFGTRGLVDESETCHFQRFSLERPIRAAEKTIALQHVRRLHKMVRGERVVSRR